MIEIPLVNSFTLFEPMLDNEPSKYTLFPSILFVTIFPFEISVPLPSVIFKTPDIVLLNPEFEKPYKDIYNY